MVALRNPKYVLIIRSYIMVEQNCVYERTMTVTYNKGVEFYDYDEYMKSKRLITQVLYENKFPLISQYNTYDYENLNKADYYPSKRKTTTTMYNVTSNGKEIASTEYNSDAKEIIRALDKFTILNGLAEADNMSNKYNMQIEEVTTVKEKMYEADVGYTILMPYALLDTSNEDFHYQRLGKTMAISDINDDADHHSSVTTELVIGRYDAVLTFTINWDAPVKSTKANIEKHLVDMPEVLTAKVMNMVESLLRDTWELNEDLTVIDCVTQSNINTKAECSPAVISSLKKRQAEL